MKGVERGSALLGMEKSLYPRGAKVHMFSLFLEFYLFKPVGLTILSRPRLLLRGGDQTITGISSVLFSPLGNYSLNTNYCYFTYPPRWW